MTATPDLQSLNARRTAAVAAYVAEHFAGNLTEAARRLLVPYTPLRAAAKGFALKPNLVVYEALARHSARPLEWWLGGCPE